MNEEHIEERIIHDLPKLQVEGSRTTGAYGFPEGNKGNITLRNSDKPKYAICYWYIDFSERDNLPLISMDANKGDIILSADFTTDYARYGISPRIIDEDSSASRFYQEIFRRIRKGEKLRPIALAVSGDDYKIRHNQVGKMKKDSQL
jgi:hypothetical protein